MPLRNIANQDAAARNGRAIPRSVAWTIWGSATWVASVKCLGKKLGTIRIRGRNRRADIAGNHGEGKHGEKQLGPCYPLKTILLRADEVIE